MNLDYQDPYYLPIKSKIESEKFSGKKVLAYKNSNTQALTEQPISHSKYGTEGYRFQNTSQASINPIGKNNVRVPEIQAKSSNRFIQEPAKKSTMPVQVKQSPFYDNINSGNDLSLQKKQQNTSKLDWSISRIESPVKVQKNPEFKLTPEQNTMHLNSAVVEKNA